MPGRLWRRLRLGTAAVGTALWTASGPVGGAAYSPPMVAALSPSRAADFMKCPLLYRFRVIDRLPERPSAGGGPRHAGPRGAGAALRPPGGRAHARRGRARLVAPQWERLLEAEPELAELFDGDDPEGAGAPGWLEAPRRWSSASSRWRTRPGWSRPSGSSTSRPMLDGLLLRGYVDRLDVAPDRRDAGGRLQDRAARRRAVRGQGAVPDEVLRAGAVAAARHGARACCSWSTSATARSCATPRTRPTCSPPSASSRRCGRRSSRPPTTGDWRPRPSRLCDWCDHRALCPAWGGTPPELPEGAELLALNPRSSAAVDPNED